MYSQSSFPLRVVLYALPHDLLAWDEMVEKRVAICSPGLTEVDSGSTLLKKINRWPCQLLSCCQN